MRYLPKVLPNSHYCAAFNRLRTVGKAKKHARRCETCKAHLLNAARLGLL